MPMWRRVARWISKAKRAQAHARALAPTPTHTQICNIAFPLQQWFRERASVLR